MTTTRPNPTACVSCDSVCQHRPRPTDGDDCGPVCVPAAAERDMGRLSVTEFFSTAQLALTNAQFSLADKLARAVELAVRVDPSFTKPGETLSVTTAEWTDFADSLGRLGKGEWSEQLETFRAMAAAEVMGARGTETRLGAFVVDKGDGNEPFPLLLAARFDRRTELAQLTTLRCKEFLDTVAQRVAGVNAPAELVANARLKGSHVLALAGLTVPYALFSDFLWGAKSATPATDGGLLFSSWGDDLLRPGRDLPRMLAVFPAEVEKLRRAGLWNARTLRFFGFVYAAVHDAQGHVLPLNMRDPRKERVAFWLRGGLEEVLADLHPVWCSTTPGLRGMMLNFMTADELAAFPRVVMMKRVVSYAYRGVEVDAQRGTVMLDHDQRCGLLLFGAMRMHGVLTSRGDGLEFEDSRLPGFFDNLLDECLAVEAQVDRPEDYAAALAAFNRRYGSFDAGGAWCVPPELLRALEAGV